VTRELVEIATTVASVEEGAAMAKDLVESRLAACAHLEPIRSIYRWQGAVCDESEVRVTFKTTTARADEVHERIRANHPYDTPAILRRTVRAGTAEYFDWVQESTGPGSES